MIQVFFVLVFCVWTIGVFQWTSVGSYGVTTLDLVQGFLYIYMLKYLVWDGRSLRFAPNLLTLCLLLLLPVVLLSALQPVFAGDGYIQFLKTFSHWVFVWLFAVICAGIDDKRSLMTNAVRAYMLWGLPVALFGVYQVIARAFDLPLAWLDVTNVSVYYARGGDAEYGWSGQLALQFENFFRATSIFSEPSVLATYMTICMMYLLVPALQGRPMFFKSKVLNWSLAAAYSGALLMTFSLSGFAGVAMLVVALLLFERGKRRFRLFLAIGVFAVLLIVMDAVLQPITQVSVLELFGQRIGGIVGSSPHPYAEGISGESVDTRTLSMMTGFEIWMQYPLTGVGIGLFSTAEPARLNNVLFSDSTFFSVLGELGSFGILVFLGLMASAFVAVIYWNKRSAQFSVDTYRLLGVMPYFLLLNLVHGLVSNSFVMAALWISFGIVVFTVNAAWREAGRAQVCLRFVDVPWRDRLAAYVEQRRAAPEETA